MERLVSGRSYRALGLVPPEPPESYHRTIVPKSLRFGNYHLHPRWGANVPDGTGRGGHSRAGYNSARTRPMAVVS